MVSWGVRSLPSNSSQYFHSSRPLKSRKTGKRVIGTSQCLHRSKMKHWLEVRPKCLFWFESRADNRSFFFVVAFIRTIHLISKLFGNYITVPKMIHLWGLSFQSILVHSFFAIVLRLLPERFNNGEEFHNVANYTNYNISLDIYSTGHRIVKRRRVKPSQRNLFASFGADVVPALLLPAERARVLGAYPRRVVVSFWQNSAKFRSFSAVSKRNFAIKYAFEN